MIFYFYEDPSRDFNQIENELSNKEDKVSKLLDDALKRGTFLHEDVDGIMSFAGQLHVRSNGVDTRPALALGIGAIPQVQLTGLGSGG